METVSFDEIIDALMGGVRSSVLREDGPQDSLEVAVRGDASEFTQDAIERLRVEGNPAVRQSLWLQIIQERVAEFLMQEHRGSHGCIDALLLDNQSLTEFAFRVTDFVRHDERPS